MFPRRIVGTEFPAFSTRSTGQDDTKRSAGSQAP